MNRRSLHFYDFGPFRINVTERLLQRGKELVPLTPKVFDTLFVLVENSGHVLEKTELMQHLWPDSFVEESSLTQNISLLRRALADGDTETSYIETIPKRGYRFVGEVHEVTELPEDGESETKEQSDAPDNETTALLAEPITAPLPTPLRRPRYLAAVSGCIAFGLLITFGVWFRNRTSASQFSPRLVAVLPFKTIGTTPKDEILGLGMADALIIKLSRLENLTVLPTSSVFRYQTRDKGAVEIGRDLGVEGVLDGTVQRDGDLVRVTAQLIRLSDGKTVWSGKFDERYSSIFALQDSISEQLAGSFKLQVAEADKKTWAAHPTDNTEAYEAYLTGLYFWNRRTRENLPKAITYLEQAVEKDPNFAQARAILADCYYLSVTDEYISSDPAAALKRAEASVNKALELDNNLAEAHTVNAGLKLTQRKYEEAGREFRRALELKPSYAVAHVRYAYFLFWDLRLEEALNHMRRAQQLDPVSSVTNGALAGMLYNSRDFDGCIAYSKRALDLEPNSFGARLNLGEAYAQKRMFNEAHAEFDKVQASDPRYTAWEKAYTYAVAGQRDDVNRMLAEVEKLSRRRNHLNYSIVYGALGDLDKAFAELYQIELNRMTIASITYEPQFDHIRSDARFADFMKRRGLAFK
jgi:DNA-binding winged helix-turn-helix (wHTH) protein/TolB-like protein/Tfp pilus assembly protein PilF